MVGTRTLARLLTHATTGGTKVVLVGDPCQLPEIEAGGTFVGLQHRLGARRLVENRRQTSSWERATLAELRAGDPDRAIDDYLEHDRVHRAPTDGEARDRLVDAWMGARTNGDDVLMVAARLGDVDDLNQRARNILRNDGYLGEDQVVLGGRPFAERDEVLALRNDYPLGLLNGTRATVEQIDTSRQEMTLATTDGANVVVPLAYGEAGHLTHGYATTIHKAQGATVDRCYLLGDDTLTREHAYTALSRGRHHNELYIVAPDRRVEERHGIELEPEPLDAVRHAIRRSGAKRLAVDQTRTQPRSIEQLRCERDQLRAVLALGPVDPARDLRDVAEAIRSEKSWRDNAQWRLDTAHEMLDDLGPIGRHTHRTERKELERRIDDFGHEIDRQDQKLAGLENKLERLEPLVVARTRWEHDHRDDFDQLDSLNHQISWTETIDRIHTPARERDVEPNLGIEL